MDDELKLLFLCTRKLILGNGGMDWLFTPSLFSPFFLFSFTSSSLLSLSLPLHCLSLSFPSFFPPSLLVFLFLLFVCVYLCLSVCLAICPVCRSVSFCLSLSLFLSLSLPLFSLFLSLPKFYNKETRINEIAFHTQRPVNKINNVIICLTVRMFSITFLWRTDVV